MSKQTYAIGEQEPWRFTKASAYRLLMAISKSDATLVTTQIDLVLGLASIRVSIADDKLAIFKETFGDAVVPLEAAGGSSK